MTRKMNIRHNSVGDLDSFLDSEHSNYIPSFNIVCKLGERRLPQLIWATTTKYE
jgi:hypothetical protein